MKQCSASQVWSCIESTISVYFCEHSGCCILFSSGFHGKPWCFLIDCVDFGICLSWLHVFHGQDDADASEDSADCNFETENMEQPNRPIKHEYVGMWRHMYCTFRHELQLLNMIGELWSHSSFAVLSCII